MKNLTKSLATVLCCVSSIACGGNECRLEGEINGTWICVMDDYQGDIEESRVEYVFDLLSDLLEIEGEFPRKEDNLEIFFTGNWEEDMRGYYIYDQMQVYVESYSKDVSGLTEAELCMETYYVLGHELLHHWSDSKNLPFDNGNGHLVTSGVPSSYDGLFLESSTLNSVERHMYNNIADMCGFVI